MLLLVLSQILSGLAFQSELVNVIQTNDKVLERYIWNLCVTEMQDTIIVLVAKESTCLIDIKTSEIEFTDFVQDRFGYRLYSRSWYIKMGLFSKSINVFPEKTKVYFWNCPE